MNGNVIEVFGKTFKLEMNLEVFSKLGEKWGLETLDEVTEQFGIFVTVSQTGLSFKAIAKLSELMSSVICVNNEEQISAEEIRKLKLDEFQHLMMMFMSAFSKSIPKQPNQNEKKPKAPKK